MVNWPLVDKDATGVPSVIGAVMVISAVLIGEIMTEETFIPLALNSVILAGPW